MANVWQRPFLPMTIYMPVFYAIIMVVVGYAIDPRLILVYLALGALLAIMTYGIISWKRRQMKDIWYSSRMFVTFRAADLLGPLEKALRDAGLEPAARKGLNPYWTTLDLKGGLNLTVIDAGPRAVLYVGPDRDETRRDVEGIKRVVDKALAGMEAQPPSRT